MVAELNEIWGETTKTSECDKIIEHIKNCPECQQKLKGKQQVVEKFQNQPVQKTVQPVQRVQPVQPVQRIQRVQPSDELDLVEKFFEYSDVILIGLTIYLVLKAL